jgi:hypothetical protein
MIRAQVNTSTNSVHTHRGGWLYRDAISVPEPSVYSLMLVGLLGQALRDECDFALIAYGASYPSKINDSF